ncbi:RNA-directed DNA polymerase, eukaryota [Tanacetum coccineum]
MGSHRSKEDDVNRISISIYVTNFPEIFSAKELFQSCKQYGHVVDSFIPRKRTKEGKRFGFVRFINVFNVDRYGMMLDAQFGWVINAFTLIRQRFQRVLVNKGQGADHKKVANSSRPIEGDSGSSNSYVNAVKNHKSVDHDSPAIVLDEDSIQETRLEEIDLFSVRRLLAVIRHFEPPFIVIRGVWLLNGIDLMIIAVYAPHDPRDKCMLWDYLAHVINQWQGEVVIMGDFNEVHVKSYSLDGSAFTWCHNGITLGQILMITDRFLLREVALVLWSASPADSFHHIGIHLEGFNDFVTSTWNSAPSVDSNGMLDAVSCKGTGMRLKRKKRMEVLAAPSFSPKPSGGVKILYMRFRKLFLKTKSGTRAEKVSKRRFKRAVWGCGTDKSPGPDGFSFGFYRHFWPVIEQMFFMAVNLFLINGEIPWMCKWRNWIQSCLTSSKGSILVNGCPTNEFQFYKGLKQGDPLSPFLFILVMESLHLFFKEIREWSDGNISTLIHVLKCFFHASGLKINLNKRSIPVFPHVIFNSSSKVSYLGVNLKSFLYGPDSG